MHGLWIFFLKKRAFSYMLMGTLTLGGLYSAMTIPKESAPEVVIPFGIVTTTLRGASAEDTEKLITNKLEDEIANLENIDKVTSSSLEGMSIVSAQFNAKANIDKSIQDLKDAVDRAKVSFPSEADELLVLRILDPPDEVEAVRRIPLGSSGVPGAAAHARAFRAAGLDPAQHTVRRRTV